MATISDDVDATNSSKKCRRRDDSVVSNVRTTGKNVRETFASEKIEERKTAGEYRTDRRFSLATKREDCFQIEKERKTRRRRREEPRRRRNDNGCDPYAPRNARWRKKLRSGLCNETIEGDRRLDEVDVEKSPSERDASFSRNTPIPKRGLDNDRKWKGVE